MNKILLLLSCLLFTTGLFAQKINVDSMRTVLKGMKSDTNKVNLLNELSFALKYEQPEQVQQWVNETVSLSKKLKFTKGLAIAYKINGILLDEKAKYAESIAAYVKASHEFFKINDSLGAARVQANIAIVYNKLKKHDEALAYFREALPVFERKKFGIGVFNVTMNFGICYVYKRNADSAIFYLERAKKIMLDLGFEDPMLYGNLGNAYMIGNDYKKAIPLLEKCLALSDAQGNAHYSANIWLQNLGTAYSMLGQNEKAISYLLKSEAAIKQRYDDASVFTYNMLANVYAKLGKFPEAYKAKLNEIEIRDSIYKITDLSLMNQMRTTYETEKKNLQISNLNKQQKLDQLEKQQAEKQKTYYLVFGIVLVVIALLLLYGFIQKRKSNKLISEQKQQVETQNHVLEEKNKEILDSITYAKRLQDAILPSQKIVTSYLKQSFTLFKPRDIVAGDFYWMETREDAVIFAVADCTGHGVPGAMVSVVGANCLNRCVNEFNLAQPAAILDKLTLLVEETFTGSENDVKDGMDISLCNLNLRNQKLQWAGANNPLWILRKDATTMDEYKPDKQPVGKFDDRKPFTNHEISLQKGDSIYLFSDGFSDQFGGKDGKKLKNSEFKKLLLEIKNQDMDQQKKSIDDFFNQWMGELEQVDDVCVIGIRI